MADGGSSGCDAGDDLAPCIVTGIALTAGVYQAVKGGACATECLDPAWLACVGAAALMSDAAPAAADQEPPSNVQQAPPASQGGQPADAAAPPAASERATALRRQSRRPTGKEAPTRKMAPPPDTPPPPAPLPRIPLSSQRLARSWAAGDYGAASLGGYMGTAKYSDNPLAPSVGQLYGGGRAQRPGLYGSYGVAVGGTGAYGGTAPAPPITARTFAASMAAGSQGAFVLDGAGSGSTHLVFGASEGCSRECGTGECITLSSPTAVCEHAASARHSNGPLSTAAV